VAGSATDPAGSVGRAVQGAEVRLGADNEVLVRAPGLFSGYLGDADASKAAIDGEGWLHTGDVGSLDDDVLSIVGRIKDIVITSNGHRASPRAIEARLEESPYVRTAVLVGDELPCLGALIVIDATSVGDWAADRGGAFTTFATLAALPEVRELVGQAVAEANAELDERDRVGCFAVLPQELGDDEELMTATGKVRRHAVRERFKDLITKMYAERESVS
jgi:long-chain acyl-CoA synthetase